MVGRSNKSALLSKEVVPLEQWSEMGPKSLGYILGSTIAVQAHHKAAQTDLDSFLLADGACPGSRKVMKNGETLAPK